MEKIVITGGSGFIGTNLISMFLKEGNKEVLSLDIETPKIHTHRDCWERLDIRDFDLLNKRIKEFLPDFVIHLAARTDLNGKTLECYDSNTTGVLNLLKALNEVPSIKRVIFASSMYVCKPGYTPKSDSDYMPHTIYGESKVQTELIIKDFHPQKYSWCIVRPTSIWGPWFGEPYANFFKVVMSGKYFHMGDRACTKTYGYVENTTYQLAALLDADADSINHKLFYLGDYEPYDISDWANEIAECIRKKIPTIPFVLFRLVAWCGDMMKWCGISFPMTSFRLKNMTTDNIHDLKPIQKLAPNLPANRKKGNEQTIKWMKNI